MLIKSTLLSIHTYFMSGSSQCYRRTEKISKKLPIGFGKQGKEASLGVVGDCYNFYVLWWPWAKDFRAFNTALSAKWLWRFWNMLQGGR